MSSPRMPEDARRQAIAIAKEVIASPGRYSPEMLALAQLVFELIRRGQRFLPVYQLAIEAYRTDGPHPDLLLELKRAVIAAARAEDADDAADAAERKEKPDDGR